MKGKNIYENITESYLHMERYVNNGSPSGWTKLRSTSEKTNPFTGDEMFSILEFKDEDLDCINIGERNSLFERGINYAHPDSLNSEILRKSKEQ